MSTSSWGRSLAGDFSTLSYGAIPSDVQARLSEYRTAMRAYEP